MRRPGDWMKPVDERLLEWIDEYENMTPVAISSAGEVPRVDVSETWAGERLRELCRYGLLVRIDRGLYGISDTGRAYLNGEVDADELERKELDERLADE